MGECSRSSEVRHPEGEGRLRGGRQELLREPPQQRLRLGKSGPYIIKVGCFTAHELLCDPFLNVKAFLEHCSESAF